MNDKPLLHRDLRSFFPRPVDWPGPLYFSKLALQRHRQLVTGQLAAIIAANSPLPQGLENAALDTTNWKLEEILLKLRDDISEGMPLSEAMRKRPRFFPRAYADLVKAGEETGKLGECLSELAEQVDQAMTFRFRVGTYLGYLGLIAFAQVAAMSFYVAYLAGQLANILHDYGAKLPPSATMLLALSEFFRINWPWVMLAVCGAVVVWKLLRRLMRGQSGLSADLWHIALAIPVLRNLCIRLNLGFASLVLSKLLGAGAPLDEALHSVSSLDVNVVFAAKLRRLRDRVRLGETLANAVEADRAYLPKAFRSLIAIGEDSGRLPETLDRIAKMYEREARKNMRILIDVLAPLGVIALGCMVLLIDLSVFQTLVSITDVQIAMM